MTTVECHVEPGSAVETVIALDTKLSDANAGLADGDRADHAALADALYAPEFTLNSPANKLQSRAETLEIIGKGPGWFSTYERTIEAAYASGDVVVLMGREVVVYEDFGTPYDGRRVHRRFTNVWRLVDGAWMVLLRHASTARVEDA